MGTDLVEDDNPPKAASTTPKENSMSKIVCAAFIANEKVLLVKRAPHRKWSANLWDLVGGHVDKGEDIDVALVRECREEVGLQPLAFSHEATLYQDTDRSEKTPFHVYAVRSWNGGAASMLGDEHSELGWFSSRDVETIDLALDGYRPVILQILAA